MRLLEGAAAISGHNVLDFDIPALQKVYPWFKPRGKIIDTLLCTRLIWTDIADEDYIRVNKKSTFPPRLVGSHSLKAWGYRLGVMKGDFGETTDWKEWSPQMQKYCEQDVVVNVALLKHIEQQNYSAEAIALEHRFVEIIYAMTRHGFAFDVKAAGLLQAKIKQRHDEIQKQLVAAVPPRVEEMKTPEFWLGTTADGQQSFPTKSAATKAKAKSICPGPLKKKYHYFNPASRKQVADFLISKGWKPTKATETGQPTVDEETLEGLTFPEGKLLAEYFMLEKRLGQLAEGNSAWLVLERNGRVHGEVITNGAVTGRCGHRSPNLAQVPRVGSPYGSECRALFVASPGKVLVGADASGLELRCLAHYLGRHDDGAYAKIVCEGDVHTSNQQAFGLPPGREGRNNSKTGIYAVVYGAANEKFGSSLVRLEDQHEAAAARVAVPAWAKKSMLRFGALTPERIRNWQRGAYARQRVVEGIKGFGLLTDAVSEAVKRGFLRGLDGRRLKVRSQHSALNTLLQSAGALLVKKATVRWFDKLTAAGLRWGEDFALVAHVHDEIQAECKPEFAEQVGKAFVEALKEVGQEWGFRCPLTGEFKSGRNWAETH